MLIKTALPERPPRGAWHINKGPRLPPPPQPEGLLESEITAIPVRITILKRGILTGWDDGALGFDEDAVWFSGAACSFRVFAQDLYPLPQNVASPRRTSIDVRDGRESFEIEFDVVPSPGRDAENDVDRIVAELWRLRKSRRPSGTSQFPPLTPRPGTIEPFFAWLSLRNRAAIVLVSAVLLVVWPGVPTFFGFYVAAMISASVYSERGRRANALAGIERDERALAARETAP